MPQDPWGGRGGGEEGRTGSIRTSLSASGRKPLPSSQLLHFRTKPSSTPAPHQGVRITVTLRQAAAPSWPTPTQISRVRKRPVGRQSKALGLSRALACPQRPPGPGWMKRKLNWPFGIKFQLTRDLTTPKSGGPHFWKQGQSR